MRRRSIISSLVLLALALPMLSLGPSMDADGGGNHQISNAKFGVSGGNVNDASRSFCCSGTLGSLVTDGAHLFILSNNHVLARADQAVAGEDISQPGLIDNGCRIPPIVADFTSAPALGSNVDAAIAQLRPGAMNTTGDIEDIGTISSVVKAPAVGLSVAKSGRTTGFTTGTIGSINASLSVQYQKGCGKGKKFTVSYTNQVVINSNTFSAGGDSGSLIVSNTGCHQPVALLFAGSTTTTIGNPIGEVLSKLGGSFSFVGNTCTALTLDEPLVSGLSAEAILFATAAMRDREDELMSLPGVLGVGVGALETDSSRAAIVVYVDQTAAVRPNLPRRINGVRVRRVYTEPFVAY